MFSKIIVATVVSLFGKHIDQFVSNIDSSNLNISFLDKLMAFFSAVGQDFVDFYDLVVHMIWIDYLLIGFIAISVSISISRGFIHELLSLITWGLAFVMSLHYGAIFAQSLLQFIDDEQLRTICGIASVFVSSLMCGALINKLVTMIVRTSFLSFADRFLGLVFGLARGSLMVAFIVLALSILGLSKQPWWNQSQLIPKFQAITLLMESTIPPKVSELLKAYRQQEQHTTKIDLGMLF